MTHAHPRPAARRGTALAVLAAALGAACLGCGPRPVPTETAPPPPPAEQTEAQVHEFCAHCHAYPPPDTFPRSAWKYEVEQAYHFFEVYAPPVHAPPIDAVQRHFEERAPEQLPPAEFTDVADPLPVQFEPVPVPPPAGELRAPGPVVSNINLVHLYDDKRLDVLATDMASGLVMVLRPYLPGPQGSEWKIVARLHHPDHPDEPGNPCHTQVVDLDGDGINDILVADLGNFYPTDARCGSVIWLRGERDGTFTPITLLKDVGRVADVEAADFRGVGKMDLVVGVFGWQKTGEIRYLENRSTDRDHPQFEGRVLDKRHGTIHVPVCDLHGDGRKDVMALISQEHETIVALLNDGKGNFTEETIFTAPHPAYGSSGIQVVDMNHDGRPDVLYTNGDVLDKPYLLKPYHSVQWLENPGYGKFPWVHHPLTPMYGVHRAVAADLCGDGRLDVAAVCFLPPGPTPAEGFTDLDKLKPDSFVLLRATGPDRFERHALENTTCDHVTCAAGDVYGTGRNDIVVGNFSPRAMMPAITVWRNMGRAGGK